MSNRIEHAETIPAGLLVTFDDGAEALLSTDEVSAVSEFVNDFTRIQCLITREGTSVEELSPGRKFPAGSL